jgi:protein involved in polysaccharide export with SLBB domain
MSSMHNRGVRAERVCELKRAIVAAFAKPAHEVFSVLDGFDEDEWCGVMWWLDISGMALYLLELVRSAGAAGAVPSPVLNALEDREARNRLRTQALMKEAGLIAGWFDAAGMAYALLKGFTLTPDSVPDAALRWQTDLDFLVARGNLRAAQHFIGRLGYARYADAGTTLEFRAGVTGRPDIAKIYSVHSQRALELHVAENDSELLARRSNREIAGLRFSTLSAPDILLQQATHLLKHLCGEHTRLSWVLEFRGHVDARRGDVRFWNDVKAIASRMPNGDLALTVALWLSDKVIGPLHIDAAEGWGAERLPEGVRVWLARYAHRVLLSDATSSKYYALLRKQSATLPGAARSTRSVLFPLRPPFRIMQPAADESARNRFERYSIEAKHFLRRLRFHVVEGVRIAIESARWRRAMMKVPSAGGDDQTKQARSITAAGCVCLLLTLGCLTLVQKAHGQSSTLPESPTLAPHDSSDIETMGVQDQGDSATPAAPAADLILVLKDNSEAMVEVKPVVVDFLEEQGTTVTADAMTDQQVYNYIESSAGLRKIVTRFLITRGYISAEQVQAAIVRQQNNPVGAGMRSGQDLNGQDLNRQDLDGQDLNGQGLDRQNLDTGTALGLQQASGGSGLSQAPQHNQRTVRSRAQGSQQVGQQQSVQRESPEGEAQKPSRNVTDEPEVLRRRAPYNLLALRDLYTQVPDTPEHLKRFGSDVFVMRSGSRRSPLAPDEGLATLDVPVGPDYVLGPGDELSISIWGGVAENLVCVVNRDGGVALPEAGLVQVAGLTMERAQATISDALRTQYRNAHVVVTIAHLRSIRIFVVGDVQRPGSYEISSVASPVSALYAAGGPTAIGSLRILRHLRGEKLIGDIDLYDFMLHGLRDVHAQLQSGDTLLVPPVGPQVAIFGAVKRPAIYELRTEKNLAEVLENAGGVTVAAALTHITVDRVNANEGRQEIGLNAEVNENPAVTMGRLAQFAVKDGDRVHVASVLPTSERVVYLQGHVARPGRIAYRDNMRISDVLRSYGDMLPEPAATGEVVRLVAPDMHPETIEFNVPDVLIGNFALSLQPFDTVRVFGRYEQDAPTVSIGGEVMHPGAYPLFEGMTASQLVRTAGGFKRDALLSRADLTSYEVVNGARVSVSRRDVSIGAAVLKDDRAADVPLKAGDVLTVHQLSGWSDVGASITIEGEIAHPGSYGFQEGEHLSDVLKRAGGFRDSAYPEGAVLTRPEVALLEEKSRQELIRQIETSSAAARLSSRGASSDQGSSLQLIQEQRDQVLTQLKSRPATGRLVIHITQDLNSWAGSAADIEVRRGDVLKIPKRPGFVLVSGQVYNASAITYSPEQTAEWYLQKAGGASQTADRKHIFIIRANGEVIGRHSSHDVLSTKLNAGDTVVVPQKIQGASVVWRNLLATAQVAASITFAAAVVGL